MKPVFVSYSSRDEHVARRVCEALEARGIGCWIASRDINPGENFGEAIVRAIRSAKLMLLIFTAAANESDEIKKELVLAGQCRLPMIPVRAENVQPGGAFAYELATRQWIDLFDNWDRQIVRLGDWVQSSIAQIDPPAAPPAPDAVRPGAPPTSPPAMRPLPGAAALMATTSSGPAAPAAAAPVTIEARPEKVRAPSESVGPGLVPARAPAWLAALLIGLGLVQAGLITRTLLSISSQVLAAQAVLSAFVVTISIAAAAAAAKVVVGGLLLLPTGAARWLVLTLCAVAFVPSGRSLVIIATSPAQVEGFSMLLTIASTVALALVVWRMFRPTLVRRPDAG